MCDDRYGSACYRQSEKHKDRYTHPCPEGRDCADVSSHAHCMRYTHPCIDGADCTDLESVEHCATYHHDVERIGRDHSM